MSTGSPFWFSERRVLMWAFPIPPQPTTATPIRSLAPNTDLLKIVTEAKVAACFKNSRLV